MKRDMRVLVVLMRYDYGRPERGLSSEGSLFLRPLSELCREAQPFWYDEYMHDTALLERNLEERVSSYQPDAIFFSTYEDQYRVEFLDSLKSRCHTMAWFGDDHWRFESYTRRYAAHFTTCITTDHFALPKYRAIGARAVLSQWASDPITQILPPLPPDGEFTHDVLFIGARNEIRAWFVGRLAKLGIDVRCFGFGWPCGMLPYEEIAPQMRRARVNLNLSNSAQNDIRFVLGSPRNFARWVTSKKRAEQIKARTFEIPLAGGFQLTHYAPSLENYLDIGKEVVIFTSPEDCAMQTRYFLENASERYKIALRGHLRATAEHTYQHRFTKILDAVFGRLAEVYSV